MSRYTILRLVLLVVVVFTPLLAACVPATPAAPQIVERTVVVEKPVEKIVEKPVQQTVVVEKTVQQTVVVQQTVAPVKKTVVTIAYNGYWLKTFGPAAPPLDVVKRRSGQEVPEHRDAVQSDALRRRRLARQLPGLVPG